MGSVLYVGTEPSWSSGSMRPTSARWVQPPHKASAIALAVKNISGRVAAGARGSIERGRDHRPEEAARVARAEGLGARARAVAVAGHGERADRHGLALLREGAVREAALVQGEAG